MKPVILIVRDLSTYQKMIYRGINSVRDPLLLCTDLLELLFSKYHFSHGVSFRECHHLVGELVRLSEDLDVEINQIPFDEVIERCPIFKKLMTEKEYWKIIKDAFDLEKSMKARARNYKEPNYEKIFKEKEKKLKRLKKMTRIRI